MKPPGVQVNETDEPSRGRKVYDQTIYVTALERGTRDRSPRRIEPLPDRIELKISPQKNHRGRMKFYRARSIPELCRITLKPTGETSLEQGRMEEVYITQYTHSFDREIKKPHIVAWKLGFEGSDVAHRDSKLCVVNSPVGSKPEAYPERRRSAPPGSFVFNYDALDMPEPVHRRSKSLGLYMDDPLDFDKMDSQVGTSAGGTIDTKVGESSGGKLRPLAHEMISAQKIQQVESVDSSFWDDAFDSFGSGENYNNGTNNDVRNNVINDVRNGDITNGDVITNDAMIDDVMTNGVTTNYVRSGDVTPDDRDSREDSTHDPAKQALSLISTLRSTVKKPDIETFLRSVHETQTSKTFPESNSKNRPSMINQSKEPTFQEVSYRHNVPHGTLPRESPHKLTPRIVANNPRSVFTSEIIPRKVAPQEDLPQEDLPQDVGPLLNSKSDPETKLKRRYTSKSIATTMITSHSASKLDQIHTTSQIQRESDPEIKRKYETKPRLEKLVKITSHSASELSTIDQARFQPQQSIPRHENNPQVNSMYSYQPTNEMNKKPSRQFTTEISTVSPNKPGQQPEEEPKPETNTASRNGIIETDKKFQCEPNSEMNRDNILPKTDVCYTHSKLGTTDVIDGLSRTEELSINNPLTTNQLITNHPSITNYQESELESNGKGVISKHKTDAYPKQSKTSQYVDPKTQTKSEVRDTSYENYENVKSSRFDHSKQVESNVYQAQGKLEFITNRTPTPEQENDYYQLPKSELNTMERSETSCRIPPKQVKSHRPNTASEQVTPSQREDYYQQPNIEVRRNGTVETKQSSYLKQVENKGYHSQPRSVLNPTSEEVTREYDEGYYQQPTFEVRTLETNQSSHPKQNGNAVPNRKSNFTSNRTAEQTNNPDQNEDYYQNINSQVRTLKTAETTNQDEDYYQQPNSRARTLKTVEINPSIHSKQVGVHNKNSSNKTPQQVTPEQHEGYYQQPNRQVRKVETQNRHLKHGDVHNNDFTNKTPQNEQYYQQPKFEERRITTQTYPTEFETNTSLYEEPKDSTLSSAKCPLDQSVAQRNDKDYKKPLPEIPNERKTSESYYEMPMDINLSPIRCPLDEKSAEKNERRDSYEQVVEHIYEQPNFAAERVYEQFDYEKMKSPSNLVNTSFYAIPKSEKEVIYEQPDKNVYENINGGVDKRHPHSKLMNNEQPKAELSSSLQQENRTRSDIAAHESLPTAQINNDNTRENKNSGSTRYSGSSTNSLEHGDNLNREYSENTGSRYKNLDTKQPSTSSLRSKSNGQSTRVTYTGEVDTKKSVVSTTSSVRIDQSDGRISEGSPKSRSMSFEGELLLQNPEVEVFEETPKKRTRHKARKTPDEEISQPSVYSKTTPSKASYSNTSIARFSSFNSEASYKRRLTSAWIEQQRLNFRKAVSREPSLRRTKSVEFHKERTPSEDTADYKLRHAKSELSFEHLNAMYNPFDDKYFDVNPDRQPAKVVHASPSQVVTKAKSLERRVQKVEEPKSLSQAIAPTRASKDSLTITPLEKNAKPTNHGNREQNLSMDGNLSRQDDVVTKSEIRPWGEPSTSSQQSKPRPKSEVDLKTSNDEPNSLSMDNNVQRQDTMPTREVKPRSGVRPKSADVSGFDITNYNSGPRDVPMDENLHKRDRMLANDAVKPNSNERPRVRPKSADVSGFDITNYNGEAGNVPMEENVHHKQDGMLTNTEAKPRSNQRPRVRPKSADVSGFDITTYNDEPTLKHSKSELSVNQLKAMYDPYDENSWFSPEPASQNVSQSDSRQVEVTVHDVVHRRTRSEPESRVDRLKSGGKMKQPEPEIRKAELGSLEAEPKNITKLNSSSVLLLNVVAVGENDETKNPKFKRNAVSKSMSNIVSVTATEIENEKRLTTLESRDTRRESTRNVKPNKTGDHTVEGRGSTSQNDKPIEKLRARYIIGGERASVRYLSKSSDELTSNDNDAMTKETSPQLQGQPAVKPVKTPKKDFGIRNFFGKIRRTKSEPNLDKTFDILDIDSDHGGKKKNSQKLKEDEKNVHETSPTDSQDKLQHSSKSGLKSSSFYPKLKNFKKNFLKSKQSKADGSFNDSGLGQDTSKSEEFLESSDFSEKDIKRENVELTESQDVVRPQNIESKTIDSPASSQSINPTKSNQSYTSKSEVPQTFVQIEQPPSSKGKETVPSSSTSPVMSPRSARKRFFQGGNRITPVAVTANQSGGNRRGKEDKTASNVVVASQENRGDEGRITTEKVVEKNGRIARDTDIFVHASSPVTSTDNLPEKLDSRRMNDTTVKSAQPRFQFEPKSHEDKERFPSTSKESMNEESQERTTSYRISEVSSRTTKSRNRKSESDENSSRFANSFMRGDDQNSTAVPNTNTVIAHKNTTTYSMSTTNITKKSDSEESRSTGMNTQMNVGLNGQRNSLHEESVIVNTEHEAKNKDTGYKGLTVEINQDSTNTDLVSKHEELNTKDSKESETVISKTKHRSFFSTKIFTSAGRTNSSQSKHKPEKKEGEEFWGESEVTREKKDTTTVGVSEDPVKIGQDIELETSNQVLKKDNETTSKKNNSKEATKSREVLKEGKKTKNSSQTSREEKSEFGTKIKGFITKVLPQKDKNSSKENAGKEETVPGKTKVNELERPPDENNNATTTVSVTASPIEERKDTLSDTTTKSRRSTFVAKHLGESDSEKTRTSEEEENQVKPGAIELDPSNKNERRTRYVSKVKHMGDSKTVKTGSVEKLSEKQSSFSNKKFTTLATNESYTTQRNIENGNGKMNASFGSRDTPGAKGVQDETVTKTEVLDNVEAFDSVFDFFEKAFNDQECKNGKEGSLSKPEKLETPEELGKPESSMMVSTSTMYPEKNFGVAKESENKVKRDEKQFVKDTKQDFVVLNDRGERLHVSTTEVNLNTTDAKRKEIVSNMQNKGNTTAHVQEALESEGDRSLEEIKGFTIKHTKTSSLVLNKSMEDNLDTVGEDDDGDKKVQENLKHEELNIKEDYSRNAKTQIAESTRLVDNEVEHGTSSQKDQNATEHNPARGVTSFLVNHEDIDKEQQLKYVEKVMVSVRRGASDVKKVVRESTDTLNVESSELYSRPGSKLLEHVRTSSGNDNGDRNSEVVRTHEMPAEEANLARSSPESGFGNGITSVQSSFPFSKPLGHGRSSSGEGNGNMILTHDVASEDARFARSSPGKNGGKGVTKQDKTRILNVDEDWGHAVEEFVVKNKEETTNALNEESHNVGNDSGDELLQLLEEEIGLENTPKQPEDTFTPIQDAKTGNSTKSSRGDSPNSQFNSTAGGSQTLIHTTSKSVEVVDNTDGPRFGRSLDAEESKKFGTPRNEMTATGPFMPITQSSSSTSSSLVKTVEMKSTPPPSSIKPQTKNQTTTFYSNSQEQQTATSTRSVISLKQQNETVVSSKLSRPKSLMNKEAKKATVSTLQENSQFKGGAGVKDSSVSMEKRRYEPRNEMLATNVVPKQKPKPPPVLPKPKRNKGKEVSQVKIGDARHDENEQRKPAGFLDVQNNNLSFVGFQSFQGNYQGSAVKDEQKMFHSTQNYQAAGFSRESFASGRVISTERREVSSSVTMKQFKNESMATSETFKQPKNGGSANEALRRNESNKEKTSNNGKQRKNRGTTASETSEDLSVRLQRLLCEDDSMSEPEDSSVTHEASSTIYSFSEDSEFDTNLMARRYKSLERPRKTPATAKIPRSSHVSMDESSDEEIFRNTTKLNYRMYSKTL